eukprot:GHVP01031615.1.p1 GENE.GHVP01031615.1~~GHVP01031615.1.p1  ORF type:complete len:669 (-),score=135.69 GHVP01031615.1:2038-4044(-)
MLLADMAGEEILTMSSTGLERQESRGHEFLNPDVEVTLQASQDADEFFQNLAKKTQAEEQQRDNGKGSVKSSTVGAGASVGDSPVHHNEEKYLANDARIALLIKSNLILGDYVAAIELCLHNELTTCALLIAEASKDAELYRRTRTACLNKHKNLDIVTTVSHILTGSFDAYVAECDLTNWHEALAFLVTHAYYSGNFAALSDALGNRILLEKNEVLAAVHCFILARKFSKVLELWTQTFQQSHAYHECRLSNDFLLDFGMFIEKIAALRISTKAQTANDELFQVPILEFCSLLFDKAQYVLCWNYLLLIAPSTLQVNYNSAAVLKDARHLQKRVYFAASQIERKFMEPSAEILQTPLEEIEVQMSQEAVLFLRSHQQQQQVDISYQQQPQAPPHQQNQIAQQPTQAQQTQSYPHQPVNAPKYNPFAFTAPQPPVHSYYNPPTPSMPTMTAIPPQVSNYNPGIPEQAMHPTPHALPTPAQKLTQSHVSHPPVPTPPLGAPHYPQPTFGYQQQQPASFVPTHKRTSPAEALQGGGIPPGMPVPWPLPNDSMGTAAPQVQAPPSKIPMEPTEIRRVMHVLELFLGHVAAQEPNQKDVTDARRRLKKLENQLEKGDVTKKIQDSLSELTRKMEVGDYAEASRLLHEVSINDYKSSGFWVVALKRWLPHQPK